MSCYEDLIVLFTPPVFLGGGGGGLDDPQPILSNIYGVYYILFR